MHFENANVIKLCFSFVYMVILNKYNLTITYKYIALTKIFA